MSNKSTVLLEHHLKELKLPTFLKEYDKVASRCAAEGVDHPDYLLRLSELELIDRNHRMVDRRIKEARFPTVKSLDTFDFLAIPSLNKALVLELARCEYVERREGEHNRPGQQWHWEDPYSPGSRPGCVSERTVRGLHHGRRSGPRVD